MIKYLHKIKNKVLVWKKERKKERKKDVIKFYLYYVSTLYIRGFPSLN